MEILETILTVVANNLEMIVVGIVAIVARFIWKDKTAREDAVASIKTGVMEFLRENPQVKNALLDGKITKDEWKEIFAAVGPQATAVATGAGAKVLKKWLSDDEKPSVGRKYIEAAVREIAKEFGKDTIVEDPA